MAKAKEKRKFQVVFRPLGKGSSRVAKHVLVRDEDEAKEWAIAQLEHLGMDPMKWSIVATEQKETGDGR